ncbi:MAG: recombinase family protein [Phycisphaeraceae bacterium]
MDEFEKAGVAVRFVHQPELTFGAQGRLLRHVMAAFAVFERDMITARLAESRTYLKKHGRRLAGKVPYGYEADPHTRQLVPNAEEAARVVSIFDRAAKGERPKQIADAINELNWPTKIYHAKRSGKTTGGGKWTARQITDTLRNPVYSGRFAEGADTRDGCHEAIVDRATFDAVQQQLDSRRTTKPQKRTRHDHLPFRQKIVCPRCGRFLTTHQTTRRISSETTIVDYFYQCGSTAGGRPPCPGVRLHAWRLEQAVLGFFDDAATWRTLFGQDASELLIHQVMQTWRELLPLWKRDWLREAIQRIEITETGEAEADISITFTPDAAKPFLGL